MHFEERVEALEQLYKVLDLCFEQNEKITMEEFQQGLGGPPDTEGKPPPLICCGGNCPFSSWCEAEAYQLGFGMGFGAGGTVSNTLSARDFARRLIETNRSQWIPRCMTTATLRHTPYARKGSNPGLALL